MGDPRRQKKKYVTPKRPFDSERFEQELEMIGSYGLRNKRELWRHKTELSRYRRTARNLLALPENERRLKESELVNKLSRIGVLSEERHLDKVLDLTLENVLERRLQTIVFRKGLACSMYHARQLVTHGHIALGDSRVTTPSRMLTVTEEEALGYSPKSSLRDDSHPARIAASDVARRVAAGPEDFGEGTDEREPLPGNGVKPRNKGDAE